jgi:hypothetical protein
MPGARPGTPTARGVPISVNRGRSIGSLSTPVSGRSEESAALSAAPDVRIVSSVAARLLRRGRPHI